MQPQRPQGIDIITVNSRIESGTLFIFLCLVPELYSNQDTIKILCLWTRTLFKSGLYLRQASIRVYGFFWRFSNKLDRTLGSCALWQIHSSVKSVYFICNITKMPYECPKNVTKKMECLHFTNGSNVLPAWKMTFDIIGNQYLMS